MGARHKSETSSIASGKQIRTQGQSGQSAFWLRDPVGLLPRVQGHPYGDAYDSYRKYGWEKNPLREVAKGHPKTLNWEKKERPYEGCLGYAVNDGSGFETVDCITGI